MKHYSSPLHKGIIEGVEPIEQFSNRCVDNSKIYLVFENNIVKKIRHESVGCAVYLSSMDIMADQLIGKTKKQALKVTENFEAMINGFDYSEEHLGDLVIYSNVGKQLNRAECALTTVNGYKTVLKNNSN